MHRVVVLASVLASMLSTTAIAATEDPLPRRGYFGVSMSTQGAAAERGVLFQEILPGSSAEAAGLLPQDVLTRLNGQPIEGPGRLASAIQTIQHARSGQTLEATIIRTDTEKTVPVALQEFPREFDPAFDTIYDAILVDGALHRVITTMPRGAGPHPVLFFIQGLGCTSVEAPMTPQDPVRQLITGVTKQDFATLRVEKSGCGDSQGPPCAEIDFQTEQKAYRAAMDYILNRADVDAARVYIFGHSMGGVFAPLVAAERPVSGIIVYGAMGVDLPVYFRENDARQMPMMGHSGARLETQLGYAADFVRMFLGERLTPAQITEREPALRSFVNARMGDATHLFGRHYTFWHQLDDLDLPSPWTKVDVPVLALWGTSDVAATRGDHPRIAETVNARHPGLAEFREVPGTGHGFELSPSMEESMRNGMQGEFNRALISICADWMRGRSAKA